MLSCGNLFVTNTFVMVLTSALVCESLKGDRLDYFVLFMIVKIRLIASIDAKHMFTVHLVSSREKSISSGSSNCHDH